MVLTHDTCPDFSDPCSGVSSLGGSRLLVVLADAKRLLEGDSIDVALWDTEDLCQTCSEDGRSQAALILSHFPPSSRTKRPWNTALWQRKAVFVFCHLPHEAKTSAIPAVRCSLTLP